MKFQIYGSCVTRDIFSIMNADDFVVDYRARCSIHSYTAPALREKDLPDLSSMTSKFQERMVRMDFTKHILKNDSSTPIIVDFIDERFNVLSVGESLVTASNEFNKIAAADPRFKVAFRRDEGEETRFREACAKFAAIHLGVPIILHISRYATHRRDGNDSSLLDEQTKINRMNSNLEMYERIFCEEVPVIFKLEVAKEFRLADVNHKWGLAPFHYVQAYYDEALRLLKEFHHSNY
jgi:hypothetical protein